MTAQELRKEAQRITAERRAEGKPHIPGAAINLCPKDVLENYVLHGIIPENIPGPGSIPPPPPGALDPVSAAILATITPHLELIAKTNVNEVMVIVKKALESFTPPAREMVVKALHPSGESINVGQTHPVFEKALRYLSVIDEKGRRPNICFVGPTGSGKTHLAEQLAKALPRADESGCGVDFYATSVCSQTTEARLMGYMNATGGYSEAMLYKAYKEGGIFLLDEMDAGNPNVGVVMNALTSNGWVYFPNGERVNRSANFAALAAANTWGNGADKKFVGRCPVDEAVKDRYIWIPVDYDEELERSLTGNSKVCRMMHDIRKKVFASGEQVTVSPRSIYTAHTLVSAKAGSEQEVIDDIIWGRVSKEVRAKCGF